MHPRLPTPDSRLLAFLTLIKDVVQLESGVSENGVCCWKGDRERSVNKMEAGWLDGATSQTPKTGPRSDSIIHPFTRLNISSANKYDSPDDSAHQAHLQRVILFTQFCFDFFGLFEVKNKFECFFYNLFRIRVLDEFEPLMSKKAKLA